MDNSIKVNENGVEKEYEIFALCKNEELNKDYIIYGNDIDIYASQYKIDNNDIVLIDIENEEEFDYIDRELDKYAR